MAIVSAPFTRETFSPTAQSEQELAYELLNEAGWTEEAYLAFSDAFLQCQRAAYAADDISLTRSRFATGISVCVMGNFNFDTTR